MSCSFVYMFNMWSHVYRLFNIFPSPLSHSPPLFSPPRATLWFWKVALDHRRHFHTPLFVCVCICELTGRGRETWRAETGGAWGGGTLLVGRVGAGCRAKQGCGRWGGIMGLCCYMMFILVMYLTVEDNRGLSVWFYEKNLNTNTKTFVWRTFKRNLVMEKTYIYEKKKYCSNI